MNLDKLSQKFPLETMFIGLYAIIVSYFNLSGFPEHFKDESWFLTVIIREYAEGGNPFTHMDAPIASSGPILYLPILLLSNIFSRTILISRIIPATYFFGSIILYYQILKKCNISLILSISSTILYVSYFSSLGRRFLGEVPSIFFVLLAIFLILVWKEEMKIKDLNTKQLTSIGILFGLAFSIKEISGLFFGVFFLYYLNPLSIIAEFKSKTYEFDKYLKLFILGFSFILPTLLELVWMISTLGIGGTMEFFGSSSLYDRHIGFNYSIFASLNNAVSKFTGGQFYIWIPSFLLIIGYYYYQNDNSLWFLDYNNYIILGYTLYYLILDIGWIRHYSLTIISILFAITLMINQIVLNLEENDMIKIFMIVVLLSSQFTLLLTGNYFLFFSPILLFGITSMFSVILILELNQKTDVLNKLIPRKIKRQITGTFFLILLLPTLAISGFSTHVAIITDDRNDSSIEIYSYINT